MKNIFKIISSHIVFYLVAISFSIFLMTYTFRYQDGQLIIASKLWSDFGAHLPLIRSFSLGNNFPPEYTTFPNVAIKYHYFFYLIVALIERIGFNLAFALNIMSIIGFAALLILIYHFSLLIFQRKTAAVLAVIFFLFNGSLSFLELEIKGLTFIQIINKIVHLHNFLSFGPWDSKLVSAFNNLNIFTNQRHLAFGYTLALLLIWPLLKAIFNHRDEKYPPKLLINQWQFIVICLVFSFLPLFHQASYFMAVVFCFACFILFFKELKQYLKIYVIAFLFSLPFFLSLASTVSINFKPGYLAKDFYFETMLKYWFFNLGLYLPLAFFVWLKLNNKVRKIFIIALSFLVMANLFQFSTDMINNHKLINFFMIFYQIILAGVLIDWQSKKIVRKLFLPLIIISLTLSGIIDFFPIINDHFYYLDDYQRSETMTWINEQTSPNAIFLTNSYLYHPASLAGRKIFQDYGYFNWSLGYPDQPRRQLVTKLFDDKIEKFDLCQQLATAKIDYIAISPGEGDKQVLARQSYIFNHFVISYISADDYRIYQVKQNCVDYYWNLIN